MTAANPAHVARSAARRERVLELLAKGVTDRTVIAARLGVNVSAVQRLIERLRAEGRLP